MSSGFVRKISVVKFLFARAGDV